MILQHSIANFTGGIRHERIGNRKYIVAPVTMIVPGVLHGSRGPLLYPEDEIKASSHWWDGVILTDGHLPDGANGKRIRIQQEYALGYVQGPQVRNGRLTAEGWFDVDRTRRINPNILKALERGDKIEASTGLGIEFDSKPGIHNGKLYDAVARNFRPDHLAVLLGKRGACSLTDGCGINNDGPRAHSAACVCNHCLDRAQEQLDAMMRWNETQKARGHQQNSARPRPVGGTLASVAPQIIW